MAGLSTRTLVKIEQGRGCTASTERKVSRGLHVLVGRLWDESFLSCEPERVVSKADGRWFFSSTDDADQYHVRGRRAAPENADDRPRSDPEEIQGESERMRLGRAGLSRGFVKTCGGRISGGLFKLNEAEIYSRDHTPAEGSNYPYLLLCSSGPLTVTMRGKTHLLNTGESIVFQGDNPFSVEPPPSMLPEELPCKFYFVCLRLFTPGNGD